jgi:L-amino acid N-acyltransferase YncA
MEQPPGLTVVGVQEGRLVGSAKMGPNRPGRGSHVATASFMVDPAFRGRGIGTALGQFAIDWARGSGFGGMQFNAVVETNEAAVGLWLKLGFVVVGTVPRAFDHPDHGLVGLHVMYRDLAPPSAEGSPSKEGRAVHDRVELQVRPSGRRP